MAMQMGNMGFGSRFDLNKAYAPSLQGMDGLQPGMVNLGPNGMPGFGASAAGAGGFQPTPSLMDLGQAQQAQPGSMMGFGDTSGMMAGGGGTDWAGAAQGLLGMLGSKQGGGEGEQAPPPPPSPILQGRSNGKLDELLARYGISTI